MVALELREVNCLSSGLDYIKPQNDCQLNSNWHDSNAKLVKNCFALRTGVYRQDIAGIPDPKKHYAVKLLPMAMSKPKLAMISTELLRSDVVSTEGIRLN